MKFLCLIYMNEEERDTIPAEQWEPLMEEGFAFGDEYRERGVFIHGRPLQPVRTAVTPRRSGASAGSPTVPTPRPRNGWPDSP